MKRYDPAYADAEGSGRMELDESGEYVLHTDAALEIARLERERDGLRAALEPFAARRCEIAEQEEPPCSSVADEEMWCDVCYAAKVVAATGGGA